MLVRIQDKIKNFENIKEISVDSIHLDSVFDDVDAASRALFAITIAIETQERLEKFQCFHMADEEDSKIENFACTTEKVKEYALKRLEEIFGAANLQSI